MVAVTGTVGAIPLAEEFVSVEVTVPVTVPVTVLVVVIVEVSVIVAVPLIGTVAEARAWAVALAAAPYWLISD